MFWDPPQEVVPYQIPLLGRPLLWYGFFFALGFFAASPGIAPEWRLFAITGFLGGLTTFSAFSGEAMVLLQRGDYGWALAHSALHLAGSILCCIAGFATWRAISS